MRQQTAAAVREADAALFVIDAREGVTSLDEEIGRWLRVETTPVVVVGNKAEGSAGQTGTLDAYRLGLGDPIAISANMAKDWQTCSRPFGACRARAVQRHR